MANLYHLQPWQLITLVGLLLAALILLWYLLDNRLKNWQLSPWIRLAVLAFAGAGLLLLTIISQPWPSAIMLELVLRPDRYSLGIDLWLHLSLLSDPSALIMTVVLIGLWLVTHGQSKHLIWLVASLVLALSCIFALQQWLQVSPPASMIGRTLNFSLPSGAITGFALLVGLGCITYCQHARQQRQLVQLASTGLIVAAALAKLFLGFHWLTDIVASLGLALLLLSISVALYRALGLHKSDFRLWQAPLAWLILLTLYSHQLAFALFYKLDYLRLLS